MQHLKVSGAVRHIYIYIYIYIYVIRQLKVKPCVQREAGFELYAISPAFFKHL